MNKKNIYVGKNIPDIIPTINNISLRNIGKIKTADDVCRIKGDIYYKDTLVGFYNPIHKDHTDFLPRKYIRIETKYSELKDFFKEYISFDCFEYKKTIYEKEVYGFESLLFDLERLNLIADFVTNLISKEIVENYEPENYDEEQEISEFGDILPVINGDLIRAIVVKDSYKMNNLSAANFIKENIPSVSFNDNYKIRVLRRKEDFNIFTNAGYIFKVPDCVKTKNKH